jgi:hypothetical protein
MRLDPGEGVVVGVRVTRLRGVVEFVWIIKQQDINFDKLLILHLHYQPPHLLLPLPLLLGLFHIFEIVVEIVKDIFLFHGNSIAEDCEDVDNNSKY